MTYSVPSTERLLNAKHFSRLPPKSVARQEALWQDTLREGSVRALCQGREYNSSGLTCHLKEAVRARNSIGLIYHLLVSELIYPSMRHALAVSDKPGAGIDPSQLEAFRKGYQAFLKRLGNSDEQVYAR